MAHLSQASVARQMRDQAALSPRQIQSFTLRRKIKLGFCRQISFSMLRMTDKPCYKILVYETGRTSSVLGLKSTERRPKTLLVK